MKVQNQSLFPALIFLTLLINVPVATRAQSNSSCRNTIDRINNEIVEKGAKKTFFQTTQNGANNRRGNPTTRNDAITVIPWPSTGDNINTGFSQTSYNRISNILNSPVLMNFWANMIMRDCNNVAVVTFCIPQSDCIASFAVSPEGKAIHRKQASNCSNYDRISWYEECYD
ncbi:hypothetical protein [Picosynechococcus sp. PCC 73109]|uniref:hypothetical protein n=1 Tax=Picosynechococcus sp. PCC 73109 TaxID=374982 RepID=UPI000AD7A69D|nr:hypothetical protein [Picosynechococcus sp. PCC 73109]